MSTTITEIAPDLFRISSFVPEINLQFNQFLARDEEPLLFHTGMKGMFPLVRDAVATLIDPATLRWIGFSHFEADECGSLNEWLSIAPKSTAVCSLVGAMVSVNDFAIREARPMQQDEVLVTGKNRFRFRQTPQVPHCWEAGLMFEETNATLLCSDLFTHFGQVEPLTTSDVVGRAQASLVEMEAGPLAKHMPYTPETDGIIQGLANLNPKTLATMHGSSFSGDGGRALRDLAVSLRETLAPELVRAKV
jgi:flavorubredoxin